jgi:hypothetical protein
MEAMIILWCQSEDSEGPTFEFRGFVRVCRTKKSFHVEIFAFDPYFSGFIDLIEDDTTTIGGRDSDCGVITSSARTSFRFKFAIKELVKSEISRFHETKVRFEFLQWKEDFVEVQLMELHESFDFSCGQGIVVFPTLFHAQ